MTKKNLKLKAAIVEADKTLEIVGKEINMTKANLSRKINGISKFTENEMQKISKAVNKPIMEIFFIPDVTKPITYADDKEL